MNTYRWQQNYIQKKTGMMVTSGGGRQRDTCHGIGPGGREESV